MNPSFAWNRVKLANVCSVLATNVRFRVALSEGSSLVILNRLGERMAGHRNRRKIEALIRLSAISSRSNTFNRSRNVAKHSFSCGGKCL